MSEPARLPTVRRLFRASLCVKTRGRHAGQLLRFANQVRLVGVTVSKGEGGPCGTWGGIGGAQERVEALNPGEVAWRDARLVNHETSEVPIAHAQLPGQLCDPRLASTVP